MKSVADRILNIQFLRFALVGGFSGAIYFLLIYLLYNYSSVSISLSSGIAYLGAIPANFIGQKFFTFKSSKRVSEEIAPFLLVHMANLLLSIGVMEFVTTVLDLHYLIGAVIVFLTVPFVTYVAMKLKVFH